jgi:transcriptional regulator with GAF, ATPase, and Fis domain
MPGKKTTSGPDTAIRNYPTLLRRYANLLELIHRLSSTVHLEDIYAQVLDGTVSLLECKAAVLLLVDPTNGDIQIASSANLDLSASQHRPFPADSSLAGKVVKEGAPIMVSDTDVPLKDTLLEFTLFSPLNPESILAVPLQSKSGVIGVLEAIDKLHGDFQPGSPGQPGVGGDRKHPPLPAERPDRRTGP